jgi:hypothetical protein
MISAVTRFVAYALFFALVACAQPKAQFDIFGKAHHSIEDVEAFPLSRYRAFPRPIRRLMQSHDIDMSHCSDTRDSTGDTLRACNRSRRLLTSLEAKGWCRGSVKHISVDGDWMRCSDIPDYSPTDAKADSALFIEADFREAARPFQGPPECSQFEGEYDAEPQQPLSDLYGSRRYSLEDEKNFPIAYYRSFPRPVQRLLQRAEIENGECRGASGDNPDTLRACNRRDRIGAELERRGWCWDSVEGIGAYDHWMRCSDVPGYYQAAPVAKESPFGEAEMHEAMRFWKERREQCLNEMPLKSKTK